MCVGRGRKGVGGRVVVGTGEAEGIVEVERSVCRSCSVCPAVTALSACFKCMQPPHTVCPSHSHARQADGGGVGRVVVVCV